MANVHSPLIRSIVREDGAWLRCSEANCPAYWGAFRTTLWVQAKAQAHRAKAHGAPKQLRNAVRPQRRNAAAAHVVAPPPAQAGVLVNEEALAALRGAKLGAGIAREGFAMELTVFKKARPGMADHNRREWDGFLAAPAAIRQYLAPPVFMAADGSWVIVRRAEDVGCVSMAERDALVRKIGHVVKDLHAANIGRIDGRVVAVDYGFGVGR